MKKIEFFKVEGDKINRVRKYCPKCGPAIFLAEHKNRFSCGKCGYTEFKGGGKPVTPKPAEEKPVETPAEQPKEETVEVKEDQPVEETVPAVEDEPKDEESDEIKEETSAEEPPSEEKKE